jgi:hypothetical protein
MRKEFIIAVALASIGCAKPAANNDYKTGAGDVQQRLPAPGTPAYNPSWYAATSGTTTYVCWDPATGSDSASPGTATSCGGCSVGSTSLSTFAEIVRRYGSNAPTLIYGNSVEVCKLSAQTAGVDPVFFYPKISGGGFAALVDTLVPFYSTDGGGNYLLGTVTAASQAGGTDMTIANMPTGTTAGMYVFDSTAGGYAWVESMSGQTGTMTQPLNASLVTTVTNPTTALGTAWSTGDTAVIYNIPNLTNLKAWRASGGDVVGSAASVSWVQWTQIYDPGSAVSAQMLVNDSVNTIYSGDYVKQRLDTSGPGGRGFSNTILGSFANSNWFHWSGYVEFYAGYVSGTTEVLASSLVDGNATFNGTTVVASGYMSVGTSSTSGAHFIGNITDQYSFVLGGNAWGVAALTLNPHANVWNDTGRTWVTSLLLTGALKSGTNTTAYTPPVGGTFTNNGTTQVDTTGTFPIGATISWSLATIGGTPCGSGVPYFSAANTSGNFFTKATTASCNDVYNWQAAPALVNITQANLDTYGGLIDLATNAVFSLTQ